MPLASFIHFLKKTPLHQLLFYILILLLPTQFGKHFWLDFSQVLGIRIDYLAPTIYLTDVLIVGILLGWWLDAGTRWIRGKRKVRGWWVIAIFVFALLNIILAVSPAVAIYKWIKLLELVFLGFYVSKNIGLSDYWLIGLLGLTIFYSSILTWLQLLHGGSLGGFLYFLGERTFTAATPGIATAPLDGRQVLRPYATFPHPNVLAGYVVVLLPLFFSGRSKAANWYRLLVVMVGFSTIFLTLSRTAWIVGFLLVLIGGTRKILRLCSGQVRGLREISLGIFALIAVVVFGSVGTLGPRLASLWSTDKQAVTIRQELNSAAIKMIGSSPIFGVGLGNFIVKAPDFLAVPATSAYLQPVHNIYLLIAAETGLVGLGLFLVLIILTLRRLAQLRNLSSNIYYLSLSFLSILLLGLFDHYFATLQQTQLLFAIMVGMAWGEKIKVIKSKSKT